MNTLKLLVLLFVISFQASFAQKNVVNGNSQILKGASLELPQIRVVPIKDSKTDRNYELYIELPEDYSENNNKTYPVLYHTDAMWHLEMLSGSAEYMLEDVILVGISWQLDINEDLKNEVGAHVSRFRDYSISKHSNPEIQKKYQLGQAKTHLDFIRNDVIKYVDKTYRTDPNSRTYFGYSLSGEFGAYILLTQPDTFDNYILGSPSIKNGVDYLSELNTKFGAFEESDRSTSLNANVFISYGSLEEEELIKPIEEFIDILNNRNDNGLTVKKEVIEGSHQTAFPMTAVRSIAWLSTAISHDSTINEELSFWAVPQLNNAFINAAPEDRKDGLAVGELGVDGGDKQMILTLAEEIADDWHGRFDSFLIWHKNKLLFESYYARGRITLPHSQASATKVYTGLLLGRAIQLGYLTMDDLDKPLVSFLNDLDPSKFVDGAETITLNHALTMRSGIRISEEQQAAMDKDPDRLKGQGRVQALLERSEPITKESQVFKYGGGPDLTMQVIEAVVPGSAMDFIKDELLDKLGITKYRWRMNKVTGLPEAGWLTSMTSRDMVKLGTLAINKGKWNGEQLIPEAFIERAVSRILLTGDEEVFGGGKDVSNQGYGYFWWSADLKSGNKNYYAASAQGGYGQYIVLIEELDLMIVFTAHDNDLNLLQLTAERILPAFID
jgi:predicted alpha/beta superfamily hydrolase/CubicO group peptidase (beta-lactamase class C family)